MQLSSAANCNKHAYTSFVGIHDVSMDSIYEAVQYINFSQIDQEVAVKAQLCM
jgi:hypothetical protein